MKSLTDDELVFSLLLKDLMKDQIFRLMLIKHYGYYTREDHRTSAAYKETGQIMCKAGSLKQSLRILACGM